MSKANPSADPSRPAVPLDYGRGNPAGDWWRKARGEVNEHFDGVFEFIGMLIGMLGGARQLLWAIGIGLCATGLGLALSQGSGKGHVLIGIGASIIGLIVPAPKRR